MIMTKQKDGSGDRRPKYLLYQRVIRALEELNVSEDAFAKVYSALPDIRCKMPTPEEVKAVEEFLQDGSLQKLAEKVGRADPKSISMLVTRVVVLKARGSERIEREGWPSYRARTTAGQS